MIKINRESRYADKIRSYKVMVDNKCLGKIKHGETMSFEVTKGKHEIWLKIDWCRSNKIEFHASGDEIVEFDCGNSIKGWRMFFSIVYITFLKNRYLWLKMKDKASS